MNPAAQRSDPRRSRRARSLVLMLGAAVLLMIAAVAVSGVGATLLRLAAGVVLLGCFFTCAVVAITQRRAERAVDAASVQLAEQRRRANRQEVGRR